MSRGFIKEGDQEEIPRVPMRAYLPEGVPNYVTKEGLVALKEELKDLEAERVKAGDNYIMVNFLDTSIKLLVDRINSAVEVDLSKSNKDTVSFGAWVRYNGRVMRIVGVDEADVNKGLISFISPIAKMLIGKKSGDIIELKGSEKIKVEEVSFEPMELTQIINDKPTKTSTTTEKRPRRIVEEQPDPIAQAQSIEEHVDITSPFKAEGPHRFEPEVNPIEFLPIVNERGNIVGRAMYVELHQGNKMLHPAVHLHVINGKGETTRRYWWHVAFGDTPEKTLKRKMAETLGLSGANPKLKRQYIRETKTEKELVYVFTVVSEEDLPVTPEGKEYLELFEKD
ncbi:MAG: GreA/GreB family elongation factor [Bacteroidales bacterium]|nr:GreA/GreB family elongation factor [Bacteroidales bacterium]